MKIPEGLPGEELITKGLTDLASKKITKESLLVQIGGPRLKRQGIEFDKLDLPDWAEICLYDLLCEETGNYREAYSQYNALLRRLISFEQAMELLEGIEIRKNKK